MSLYAAYALTTGAIVFCMALSLLRALKGPPVFDRILAANSFGTKTVLLIAVLGFLKGRPDFLDLALVYTLMNFLGTLAVLRFTHYGNLVVSGNGVAGETDAGEEQEVAAP